MPKTKNKPHLMAKIYTALNKEKDSLASKNQIATTIFQKKLHALSILSKGRKLSEITRKTHEHKKNITKPIDKLRNVCYDIARKQEHTKKFTHQSELLT